MLPDIRGYGDSSKPPHTDDHAPYSKRNMAQDQVEVMRQLGFEQYFVAGHDRGARVAYRMALDHPERVLKLATLDIVPDLRCVPAERHAPRLSIVALVLPLPAGRLPRAGDQRGARGLLRAPADQHLRRRRLAPTTGAATRTRTRSARSARTTGPASPSISRTMRRTSARRRSRARCSRSGARARTPVEPGADFVGIWKNWADDVRGQGIDSGHFMAEENPEETYAALRAFFAE